MIASFTREHRFLSNFYPSPIPFVLRCLAQELHMTMPTVEHAYQASKVAPCHQNALHWVLRVRDASLPAFAKRIGRELPLRPDWDEVKLPFMLCFLRLKFIQPEMRERLIATGDATLVEGNTWGDTFWGVCNGKGENHLGRLLMQVRSEIR